MRNQVVLITLFLFLSVCGSAKAQEKPPADADPKDEAVIAVLEILELMEIVDHIELLKDMEYLNEGDPNEPQK
jgi:hypothetical protein